MTSLHAVSLLQQQRLFIFLLTHQPPGTAHPSFFSVSNKPQYVFFAASCFCRARHRCVVVCCCCSIKRETQKHCGQRGQGRACAPAHTLKNSVLLLYHTRHTKRVLSAQRGFLFLVFGFCVLSPHAARGGAPLSFCLVKNPVFSLCLATWRHLTTPHPLSFVPACETRCVVMMSPHRPVFHLFTTSTPPAAPTSTHKKHQTRKKNTQRVT